MPRTPFTERTDHPTHPLPRRGELEGSPLPNPMEGGSPSVGDKLYAIRVYVRFSGFARDDDADDSARGEAGEDTSRGGWRGHVAGRLELILKEYS